jgi:hypothetical protein
MYRKSSLLPTKEAKQHAERIAIDLNPDLMKPAAVGLIPRAWEQTKEIYSNNLIGKHLICINSIFILYSIAHFAIDWTPTNLSQEILIFVVILMLDTISCLF